MKRWERWGLHAALVVITATGIAYFVMKYALEPEDPFAVINHPWQPAMLATHIMAGPVALVFFGILFRSHVAPGILSGRHYLRRSGWVSLLSFGAMVLSGHLVQIASSPEAVTAFIWIHIATSCLFVAGYGTHLILDIRFHRHGP